MRKAQGPFYLVWLVWMLAIPCAVVGQQTPREADASISLLKVGAVDVAGGQQIVLEWPVADLFGSASNYEGREFFVLLRLQGGAQWQVAGSSRAEPGGVFNVPGVQFPQAGDFELIVAIMDRSALRIGAYLDEATWREPALAVSERVSVTIKTPPIRQGESTDDSPFLIILSIANTGISPGQSTPVPAAGNIIFKGKKLPEQAKIYLAVHVPYTDRCYLYGPATPGREPNTYVIQSVPFEVPGDPQQIHLDLVSFAAVRGFRPGAMSWQAFQQADLIAASSIEVVSESRRLRSDSQRIPFIAINQIGQRKITSSGDLVQGVGQGEILVVNLYDRMAEGALLWTLTRPKGYPLWLAQGPMIPRGGPPAEQSGERVPVAWVLPQVRFVTQDAMAEQEGDFEIMVVLSTATFPNGWISPTALSSHSIESISEIVRVHAVDVARLPDVQLTITRVGGKDADPDEELRVAANAAVEINTKLTLPGEFRLYLGKRRIGDATWSFTEAIAQGKTHLVPDLSFVSLAPAPERYQLLAIVTNGLLPFHEAAYQDFLPHALATSEVITVVYGEAPGTGFLTPVLASAGPAGGGSALATQSGGSLMWWWLLLVLALVAIVLLIWVSKTSPELAGRASDRLQRFCAAAERRFEPVERIDLGKFLLGLAILGFVLYLLQHYYLRLYTAAVATATGLPARESAGMAIWLILITALVGIFFDLTHKLSRQQNHISAPSEAPAQPVDRTFFLLLQSALGVITFILLLAQILIYFLFLRQNSSDGSSSLAIAGGVVALAISATEMLAFFFITKLILDPLGLLILKILLAPFHLLALAFRFLQRLFESRHSARPPLPPPHSVSKGGAVNP